MKSVFRTIGITARSDIEGLEQSILDLIAILQKSKATILIDCKRCILPSLAPFGRYTKMQELDLLIVLGGDGTILRTIREMDDFSVPILSINRGTIGFLTEMNMKDAEAMLQEFLSGKGKTEERSLLQVQAKRGTETLWSGRVLNEAVIAQGAISRLIDLKTEVNGDPLAVFHADGVIIATPTGSTAYSLAAGGPIVHPQLKATIVTPINPHSFSQKPLVLPAENDVRITIMTKPNRFDDVQVSLTLDGQTYVTLKGGDIVHAQIAKETVKFLRRTEETYFSTLRSKLKWGERPSESGREE